jgi:hypothetical protein
MSPGWHHRCTTRLRTFTQQLQEGFMFEPIATVSLVDVTGGTACGGCGCGGCPSDAQGQTTRTQQWGGDIRGVSVPKTPAHRTFNGLIPRGADGASAG